MLVHAFIYEQAAAGGDGLDGLLLSPQTAFDAGLPHSEAARARLIQGPREPWVKNYTQHGQGHTTPVSWHSAV